MYELIDTVRLIRKFAVGLSRIVVAGRSQPHVPIPGIEYVLDVDYIPADFLPTRNSLTAQWNMHRLARHANLSDPFMDWNDDTFLGKALDLGKFVDAHTWYTERNGVHGYQPHGAGPGPKRTQDPFVGSIQTANNVLHAVFGDDHVSSPQVIHAPAVIRLSTMDWVWAHLPVEASLTRIRDIKNLQFEYTLAHVEKQIVSNTMIRKHSDVKDLYMFIMMRSPVLEMRATFDRILKKGPVCFLTLNDDLQNKHFEVPDGNGYALAHREIKRFLSRIGDVVTHQRSLYISPASTPRDVQMAQHDRRGARPEPEERDVTARKSGAQLACAHG